MNASAYPQRPQFFAQKFTRIVFKACAANEIGQNAALLVLAIAATEDAKKYSGPVTYHNGQLLPVLGLKKWEALDIARRKAIDGGWLHYEAPPPGRAREAGLYWVIIPPAARRFSDGPMDESGDPLTTTTKEKHIRETDTVGGTVGGNSLPIPIPNTNTARTKGKRTRKPRAKFVPPTLEEVAAYCKERENSINPRAWLAYYEAKGWKVGKCRMSDWKASVRYWEANNFAANGAHHNGSGKPEAQYPNFQRRTPAQGAAQ